MSSIIAHKDTNTNKYMGVLISELKESFRITATLLNTHKEFYPVRWNRQEEDTGSACLNLGVLIYSLRMKTRREEVTSGQLHELSRFVHKSAQKFIAKELQLINPEIVFEREENFDWEYSTRGFQLLRDYDLLGYYEGLVDLSYLTQFCKDHDISIYEEENTTTEVEITITKTINIDGTSIEVPKSVSTDVLDASISLLEEIARSSSILINKVGCTDKVRILRRGQECAPSALNTEQLSSISKQLDKSPILLRKLLAIGSGNGSI